MADNLRTAKTAEIKLIWFTQGKGTQDIELIQTRTIPTGSSNFSFEFTLPSEPVSFSGQLITLTWAVEAVIDKEFERKDFILSPFDQEINITSVQMPNIKGS